MALNIPLAIWMGILTITLLFITLVLGIAVIRFRKNVLKQHKILAITTACVAIIHMILAALLWFFGISI
jgi:hypothetical protein